MTMKLDMEQMEKVNGGYYFNNQDGTVDIINDADGDVLCTLNEEKGNDPEYVKKICESLGQSSSMLTWLELDCLREHAN